MGRGRTCRQKRLLHTAVEDEGVHNIHHGYRLLRSERLRCSEKERYGKYRNQVYHVTVSKSVLPTKQSSAILIQIK